jgi:hypothetical protein
VDRERWVLDLRFWVDITNDSAGLRGELCALPATHIAERCFLAALKLPRLTHDLLNMSEPDTALRVDPLFEGCRSRYDTRLSARVAFATLFFLGSRVVVTVLRIGIGTLITGPWTLAQCNKASVATVLTRGTVGQVRGRADRGLHGSALCVGEHRMQLLTAPEYPAGVTFRALSKTSL